MGNSKHLHSLKIQLNDSTKINDFQVDNLSRLSRLLGQVAHHLVELSLGDKYESIHVEVNNDFEPPVIFQLPRRMGKLEKFRNNTVDVFRCDDLFENGGMNLPALKKLVVGRRWRGSHVRNVFEEGMVFANVTNFQLIKMYDVGFLEKLGEVIPKLETLWVDLFYWTDDPWTCAPGHCGNRKRITK